MKKVLYLIFLAFAFSACAEYVETYNEGSLYWELTIEHMGIESYICEFPVYPDQGVRSLTYLDIKIMNVGEGVKRIARNELLFTYRWGIGEYYGKDPDAVPMGAWVSGQVVFMNPGDPPLFTNGAEFPVFFSDDAKRWLEVTLYSHPYGETVYVYYFRPVIFDGEC